VRTLPVMAKNDSGIADTVSFVFALNAGHKGGGKHARIA
jgi:hypothetical protein